MRKVLSAARVLAMTRPRTSRTAVVKLLLGAAFIALLVGGAAIVVGVAGLVSNPDEAAIVARPASYRESTQESSRNRAFRDDDSVYAVFAVDNGNSDPPGLGNTLRCLDMRTGLLIEVDGINNQQDAATFLQRAGF